MLHLDERSTQFRRSAPGREIAAGEPVEVQHPFQRSNVGGNIQRIGGKQLVQLVFKGGDEQIHAPLNALLCLSDVGALHNQALFDFVWNCVGALDSMDEGVANFHLWFLANLSRFLGFCPGNDYSAGDWFDIREGLYTKTRPQHVSFMTQECTRILRDMMECDVRCLAEIGLNRTQRVEFLNAVLVYFGYHLDAISAVQSVRILREVF